jgi:hypothetical protein
MAQAVRLGEKLLDESQKHRWNKWLVLTSHCKKRGVAERTEVKRSKNIKERNLGKLVLKSKA